MSETEIVAITLFAIIVGVGMLVAIGLLANSKGRDPGSWVLLGIVLGGLIPLIIILCLSEIRVCPNCRKTVPVDAKTCFRCGKELPQGE